MEIRQYIDKRGRNPFERWFETLVPETRARIVIALERLEAGNWSAAKGVGGGVIELRLYFGPGYRVYFGVDGDTLIIVLGGGTKSRQHADIETAQELWREYKQMRRRSDAAH